MFCTDAAHDNLYVSHSLPTPHSGSSGIQPAAHAKSILLIEDSEFERFTIRAALEGLTNYRVCGEATNGAEGVKKAAELKPDLVIMDLAMPLMNGLEAAALLKNAMPRVPIIMLTLYAEQLHKPMSPAFGVATVLSKSDGLAPLLETVEKLLGPA